MATPTTCRKCGHVTVDVEGKCCVDCKATGRAK